MQKMEPDDAQGVAVTRTLVVDAQVIPQISPGEYVAVEQFVEPAQPGEPAGGFVGRFGHRRVAPGEHRHDLLERHGPVRLDVDDDLVSDPAVAVEQPALARDRLPTAPHRVPGRHRHRYPRLVGLHRQQHRISRQGGGLQKFEVLVGQGAVALDEGIPDRAVQQGTDLDPARPVLGHDRRLEGTGVRDVHGDEPPLPHRGGAARGVAETQPPGEDGAAQIEVLVVVEQFGRVEVEPLPAVDAEGHR